MGRFFQFVVGLFWRYPRAAIGALAFVLGETALGVSGDLLKHAVYGAVVDNVESAVGLRPADMIATILSHIVAIGIAGLIIWLVWAVAQERGKHSQAEVRHSSSESPASIPHAILDEKNKSRIDGTAAVLPGNINIAITSPINGGILEHGKPVTKDGVAIGAYIYPISGTITYLPPGHEVWILNEESPRGKAWPQGKGAIWHDREQPTWEGQTFLWRTQDSVTIVAVAAPPSSRQMFEHYYKVYKETDKWIALDRLPAECTIVARAQAYQRVAKN